MMKVLRLICVFAVICCFGKNEPGEVSALTKINHVLKKDSISIDNQVNIDIPAVPLAPKPALVTSAVE